MAKLIFVTGASGFLGSHIVLQLLDNGYRVRAAARGPKVAELAANYAKFGDRFQAVAISDIATDQFLDALDGVDAVIHSAAPIPQRSNPEDILKGAVEGTLNVVRQAEKAGIKRIVVTSSIVTVLDLTAFNPRNVYTDKDWYPITKEKALTESNDAHPELDITTVNPPYLYGPFSECFTLPKPDYYALSSNVHIYRFLKPSSNFPTMPIQADIRDVAKAHVLALISPPASLVGRKRIVFSSPHGFDVKAAVALIAANRPALQDRLIKDVPPTFSYDMMLVDFGRIEEVLGMRKEDFETMEATILDTVDSLLAIEKQWVEQGHEISIPDV